MSTKQFTSWRSMMSVHYDSLIGYRICKSVAVFTFNSVWKFSALFNNSVGKCCLHSFYYIFLIYFHCSASIPYRGTKANWLYQEQRFPGTFAPGNKGPREPLFQGAKVPGNFRSWERRFPLGTFAPRSENTGEWKVLITSTHPQLVRRGWLPLPRNPRQNIVCV